APLVGAVGRRLWSAPLVGAAGRRRWLALLAGALGWRSWLALLNAPFPGSLACDPPHTHSRAKFPRADPDRLPAEAGSVGRPKRFVSRTRLESILCSCRQPHASNAGCSFAPPSPVRSLSE